MKLLNERVHPDKVIYANKLYCRPANQYESGSSMTNKVYDTNWMLIVFLNLKK